VTVLWQSNINKDYKLDNKILGNIHPSEIINFHSIKKENRNYLCILNSDGRFKKVLFDEDMIKSNRSFSITKLKNNIKTIDSFVSNDDQNLMILTSIGRIFKFNLSNKFLTPTSKQSQGLIIAKLLPTEKIVSCCTFHDGENIFLISKKFTPIILEAAIAAVILDRLCNHGIGIFKLLIKFPFS